MKNNDAFKNFGNFLNIEFKEQNSTDAPAGEVIAQEPEAGDWDDPDTVNVVLTVSSGDQDPSSAQTSDSNTQSSSTDSTDSAAGTDTSAADLAQQSAAAALNTPIGYSGGPIRLELIQNVNGNPSASVILDGQTLQFPYTLDITGAPGVSQGTLYLSEEINGTYQKLGEYSITFAKAE